MKLCLIRHGDALNDQVDSSRPLSEIGQKETREVADVLKRTPFIPQVCWHSPKTRAVQTAQILRDVLNESCAVTVTENLNPGCPVDMIFSEIHHTQSDVMIVGHLPFLPSLIGLLTEGPQAAAAVTFLPSTAVILDHAGGQVWSVAKVITPA